MASSVIAIGNPGAGKSTILNSLAGEILFQSGVSIGSGLTYQLDDKKNNTGRFLDTPGLADDTHRKAAGGAISSALRQGGPFKVLFFMRTKDGRLVNEDITTIKLILDAAPEIGNHYGIVFNKVPENVAKQLRDPQKVEKLSTAMFANIEERRRCSKSNIIYLPTVPYALNNDNILLESEDLKSSVDSLLFENFVYRTIPTVNLTVGAAKDIATDSFKSLTKGIEALEKKMKEDKKMYKKQKRELMQEKIRIIKGAMQQQEGDRSMFKQQLNMRQRQLNQLERERRRLIERE